jgi:ABC-2 type transport system ATP-binding protein
VVLSTHILAEVEAICRRVILINQGRKAVDSPLSELTGGGRTLEQIFTRETLRDLAEEADDAEEAGGDR